MTENSLKTDLNVHPYYDDFDEEKNFHRILFRPSAAIQARELTQSQTILQNQIQRFGSYNFKDGSIVDGVPISYNVIPFVFLSDNFNTNTSLLANSVNSSYLITNSANSDIAVRAVVEVPKNGYIAQYPLTNRWYLNYLTTGKDQANNDASYFADGEELFVYNENQAKFGTLDANNLIDSINIISGNDDFTYDGSGYAMSVGEGTIYQKGFFIKVKPQTIIVRDFDIVPTGYVVGFETTESIVTPDEDTSLNDGSAGFPNQNAPGAHRLKLTPNLVAKTRTNASEEKNFFAITEFESDKPTEQNTGEEGLNKILDVVALRMKEDTGDFVVSPFNIEPIAHHSNTDLFQYDVSSGIGFFSGYRKEKINPVRVDAPRAKTTKEAEAQIVTANYGNYIIVDELVGIFDFTTYNTIDLYDTAQNASSEYEGSTASVSGSKIGEAKIRMLKHSTGLKGKPDTKYNMYIFDVEMNSGERFSDVKSVYTTGGTFGNAKADIVLNGDSKAQIYDSTKNNLVFEFGLDGVKRLRDAGGGNDTQFVFNDIATATMDITGSTTFTINSPHNGGLERLNASVGSLSDANESKFQISTTSAIYTANLAGTLDLSGTTDITGTGTSFDTDFESNSFIRINDGGSFVVRRVTSVTNSTLLTVDADVSSANVTAPYQRYAPAGHVFDINANSDITVLSNTQFSTSIKLVDATNYDSGTQDLHCQYPVLRTDAVELKKVIHRDTHIKLDLSNNVNGATGPWNLGLADVIKLKHVYISDGSAYLKSVADKKEWFTIGSGGQTDGMYDHAQLSVNPSYASRFTTANNILVIVDHFTANNSSGAGFFSVDSYPVDDANTANTTAIQTAEIPRFFSTSRNSYVDLRNAVDFRPIRANTAATTSTKSGATTNPPYSNSSNFEIASSGTYLADPDSNFQADLEYYLPRVDLVVMNKEGDITVREGEPHENPLAPKNEGDTTILARSYVPAFPSLTVREADAYNRRDIAIKARIKTNRNYTKRDIRGLEERIERLEYYCTLNLLEQQAKNLVIGDENGLDRFKNGIFAEPFRSHLLGRVTDFEYAVSIDVDFGVARPLFKKHSVDFVLDGSNSTNIQQTGPYVTLPYSNVVYQEQRFATKYRNCVESVWQWNGTVDLYPSYDHNRDETRQPNVDLNVDLTQEWTEFANSPFGTQFGEWRTTGKDVQVETKTEKTQISNNTTKSTTTESTTTTTESERLINKMNVTGSTTKSQDAGSYVTDISMNAFMNSRIIEVVATGLRPNTKLHCHFDRINVDAHCRPAAKSTSGSVASSLPAVYAGGTITGMLYPTGEYGDELRSDNSGNCRLLFRIPAGEFRVGEREFLISNVDNLITGEDATLTSATTTYVASSISTSKRGITLNTIHPKFSVTTNTEHKKDSITVDNQSSDYHTTEIQTVVNTVIIERVVNNTIIVNNTITVNNTTNNVINRNGQQTFPNDTGEDPIAQSFKAIAPSRHSGMFMSGVGVFFRSKDDHLGVELWLVETTVGFPDSKRIIAQTRLESSEITVGESIPGDETIFWLNNPTYLENEKEYAFIIKPDGNSPNYEIWAAETGDVDTLTGEQVFSNPASGILFVSANMNTWTPLQTEDLKYKIYRSLFNQLSGTAEFHNENDEYLSVDGFIKDSDDYRIEVGDEIVKNISGTTLLDSANADYSHAVIQYVNEGDDVIHLDSSVGKLSNTDVIEIHRRSGGNTSVLGFNANTKIAQSTILTVDNLKYNMTVPRFATMEPSRTNVGYKYRGTDTLFTTNTTYTEVTPETETEFYDFSRLAVSKSNEESEMSDAKSTYFQLNLRSTTQWLSPVIDLRRKSSLFVENLINNDATNEHTRHGNATSKYISKVVTLDEGLGNAEDMKAFIGGYRPVGTDIKLYVKVMGSDDNDNLDDKLWTEMEKTAGAEVLYSNPFNTEDYREFEYNIPTTLQNTVGSQTDAYLSNGFIQYARTDGGIVEGFNQFFFKIVFLSSESARVPRLNDFRAIALQK